MKIRHIVWNSCDEYAKSFETEREKYLSRLFLQQDLNYTQLQSENLEGSLISLSYETQGQSRQHK